MFNLSGSEVIFILLLALIVLGPEKLPDAIRRFGRVYGELRRMSHGFQTELKQALDEPMREMRETADLARKAVTQPLGDEGPSVDQIMPKPIGDTAPAAEKPPTSPGPDEVTPS